MEPPLSFDTNLFLRQITLKGKIEIAYGQAHGAPAVRNDKSKLVDRPS